MNKFKKISVRDLGIPRIDGYHMSGYRLTYFDTVLTPSNDWLSFVIVMYENDVDCLYELYEIKNRIAYSWDGGVKGVFTEKTLGLISKGMKNMYGLFKGIRKLNNRPMLWFMNDSRSGKFNLSNIATFLSTFRYVYLLNEYEALDSISQADEVFSSISTIRQCNHSVEYSNLHKKNLLSKLKEYQQELSQRKNEIDSNYEKAADILNKLEDKYGILASIGD